MTNKSRPLIWILLAVLVAAGAAALMQRKSVYSDTEIGLVANAREAAKANSEKLSAALAEGKFVLLRPYSEYFVEGTIESGISMGGGIGGFGAPGHQVSSLVGMPRITRTDSDKGGAIVRIRGNAFTLAGIELRGREYTDGSGEGAVNNPKPKAEIGVEFESRKGEFWTGLHHIGPITVSECKTAFVMRGGYTDKGQFTAYEGNCDNGLIDGPILSNCDCGVRLENKQALCWKLRDAKVFGWGGRSLNHFVLVDCVRGGDVFVDGLSLNHVDACIFLVHDFNPNGPSFVCRDLKWDHVPYEKPGRLTVFEYAGRTDDPNNSWQKFRVRVDGGMNNAEKKADGTLTFDPTVLVRIPKAARQFPLDDILVDIGMMPTTGFERVGQWWRPTPALLY